MACGIEKIFCGRKEYCEFRKICEKVNPKIRDFLEKTQPQQLSAMDAGKFIAQGSGKYCTRRD